MAARSQDPTDALRAMAASLPGVVKGTACTQSSFKTKQGAFLYVGPGPKGQGFKAMFKLERSRPQAEELAAKHPDRFELGTGKWVVARFTAEKPLPKALWSRWLNESHALTSAARAGAQKGVRRRGTT